MSTSPEPVGTIARLIRYPVKSMAGESVASADLGWHGLEGDRRWAFVRPNVEKSGFPWLTIRERADMARYVPRFAEPDRPNESPTVVRAPDGTERNVLDPALAEELAVGARVIKQSRGVFDTFPVSLITVDTVAALSNLAGLESDPRRFRPNLVVETRGGTPYSEDDWVGHSLNIGAATIRIDKRDQRCAVVNVDPDSCVADPSVLRTIARERDTCLGVYGSTVTPGRIAVGDAVYLL